jgi:hypothetical protein
MRSSVDIQFSVCLIRIIPEPSFPSQGSQARGTRLHTSMPIALEKSNTMMKSIVRWISNVSSTHARQFLQNINKVFRISRRKFDTEIELKTTKNSGGKLRIEYKSKRLRSKRRSSPCIFQVIVSLSIRSFRTYFPQNF